MKRFSIMALGMMLAVMTAGAHDVASAQIITPGITPPMMPITGSTATGKPIAKLWR